MPLETKKVLWTVLSVVMVLVVVSGMALALVYPRGSSAGAPATVAAVAPPRTVSPDEYVRAVEPAPITLTPAAPAQQTGTADVIIVYGDKPEPALLPDPAAPASSATTTALPSSAPATTTTTKPYTPAPAARPTAEPKPAAKAPVASDTRPAAPATVAEYWIQAAAFTSRSRADDLQRELASKGLSTLITVKDLDGVSWYRVRIGPYGSESEAKGWLSQVRTMAGCAEAYVSKTTVQRSS
ncbi:MAG: SPOR domain-containing protein [Spirochaetales bacterium]|nr:SPOR domain-containing protein [Spirochaetales bacterium]